ncbi:hypothetical protein, partial [Streptomyces sp. H27-C3]|uniref:hypothetical protein n=1 Tax=Streptomyces sp. H27-C3 TaxID=3046305 RepID=UPI0024BAD75A
MAENTFPSSCMAVLVRELALFRLWISDAGLHRDEITGRADNAVRGLDNRIGLNQPVRPAV